MATEQDRTPLLPLTPPSATHQNTVVLCNYGDMTRLSKRTRTSGSGKTSVRMTLDIQATPLLVTLNGAELGKGPSAAIAALIRRQTQDITVTAAPSTIARRKRAAAALASGSRGSGRELARYTAARTKANGPPGWSSRIGNDSGLLANGIFATQNPKEGAWTINVTANRFDLRTWNGDQASLEAWIARYVSLVPALADPRTILLDDSFRKAVTAGAKAAVVKPSQSALKRWLDLVARFAQTGRMTEALVGEALG